MSHDTLAALIAERFGHSFPLPQDLPATQELHKLLAHRSCRAFKAESIPGELLDLLFACALSAPSKSDLQQADIVNVVDPAKRQRIVELLPSMPWLAQAPVFLVFCANHRRLRLICRKHAIAFANDHLDSFMNAAVDAGLVLMNFIRAAEAVGLGCCPISVIRNHAETVSQLLGLPQWVFPVAGLCVGYPRKTARLSPRLPLRLTVHTDTYDERDWEQAVDEYDRYRDGIMPYRQQRYAQRYGTAEFYGWSQDKARQYSHPERADFGRYIRRQGFRLD